MSRIKKKYIRWGTGAEDSNAKDVPATTTASNYTPQNTEGAGTDKVSSHLAGIDLALGSIPQNSAGDINETSFSLAESASGANVTGLSFTAGIVRSFKAEISVFIDATADLVEHFTIHGTHKATTWYLTVESFGDESNVSFDIDTAGQVTYSSSTYTGFVSGTINFRAITTSV